MTLFKCGCKLWSNLLQILQIQDFQGFHPDDRGSTPSLGTVCLSVYISYAAIHPFTSIAQLKLELNAVDTVHGTNLVSVETVL